MSKQRYIIEGEWSGYRSGQRKIVHREVTTNEKLAEWVGRTYAITYADGTRLCLSVRPCKTGERVKDMMNSYRKLIRDCHRFDVTSVDALQKAEDARKMNP